MVLRIWIFTKAQTRKIRLGTHYSSINKKIQAYVEDDNDITIEDDIVKYISFNVGISGTTAVIVDAATFFGNISSKKINFTINTGAQETHGVCWREKIVQVTKSSNISDPKIIHQANLRKYENSELFVSVVSIFKSVKPSL